MVRLQPVVFAPDAAELMPGADGFAPLWPHPPSLSMGMFRWLPVHADLSLDEVGLALFGIAFYDGTYAAWLASPTAADAVRRTLIRPRYLLVKGGLEVVDPQSGESIGVGCCCGLDQWRDWFALRHEPYVWMGHSPRPWAEHRGDDVRIWCDAELPADQQTHLDFPRGALPDLLRAAHRDIVGFLAAVRGWADVIAPEYADRLVAKLAFVLRTKAPLDLPADEVPCDRPEPGSATPAPQERG
jgi:hypothetical protein